MEQKKTPKADLENKRNTFLLLGLVISLGLILVAFEWSTKPSETFSLGDLEMQEVEEEIIPITRAEEVKPPPPPPPPKVIEVLNIVDDDVIIEDELEIEDSEADETTMIDIAPIVQADEEIVEEEEIFLVVEEMPEFPGGNRALYSFINNTVRYPVIAQENGVQGKVYLRFVVDVDGTAKEAQVLRGVDPSLDTEALRVIGKLPDFKPGKQRGRPVKVYYQAVINFRLQ